MQSYIDVSELYRLDTSELDAEGWEALWRWLGRVLIKANRGKRFYMEWLARLDPKKVPPDAMALMAAIREDTGTTGETLGRALDEAIRSATPVSGPPIRIGNDRFMLHDAAYEKWGFLI